MSKSRYARLHGSFWRHDRTAALPLAAAGLHMKAMSFCADNMTDGRVRKEMALVFAGGSRPVKEIGALILAGVWEENGDHYILRDWSQHNITVATWEKHKSEVRERVQKSRGKLATPAPSNAVSNDDVTRYDRDRNNNSLDEGRRTKDEDDDLISESEAGADHPVRTLSRAFRLGYEQATGGTPIDLKGNRAPKVIRLSSWIEKASKAAGIGYDEGVTRLLGAYFASKEGADKQHSFEWLAHQPEKFWKSAKASARSSLWDRVGAADKT